MGVQHFFPSNFDGHSRAVAPKIFRIWTISKWPPECSSPWTEPNVFKWNLIELKVKWQVRLLCCKCDVTWWHLRNEWWDLSLIFFFLSDPSVLPVMIILDKFTTLAGYFGTGPTILPDLPDPRPLHGGLSPLIPKLKSTIFSCTKMRSI